MRKIPISFNMILPVLVLALLFVPFAMNFLAHAMVGEKKFPPIVSMKLPVESTAVSLPSEVVQYTPFDITLRLDTDALAKRLNDLLAKSPHGVTMQGISGKVHSRMQAEIVGDGFHVNNPGPQVQLFSSQGETLWSWTITPSVPNRQAFTVRLHLDIDDYNQPDLKIVDLAEIHTYVLKNPAEWMRRYGIWFVVAAILAVGIWWKKRRAAR